MTFEITRDGTAMSVSITGRLDTKTTPKLEGELLGSLGGVEDLTFDLGELEYVSSTGLRLFLLAQKTMGKQGEMRLTHVRQTVMDVFEVTGFDSILTFA